MLEILFEQSPENSALCLFIDENLQVLANLSSKQNMQELQVVQEFLQSSTSFKGKYSSIKILSAIQAKKIINIVLVGVGNLSEISEEKIQELGAVLFSTLSTNKIIESSISLGKEMADQGSMSWNANLAFGALLSSYRFDQYKTKSEDAKQETIKLYFTQNITQSENHFRQLEHLAKGIFFARDCVNLPPNHLYPESYAKKIKDEFEDIKGVAVSILGENEMKKLNMGALIGVGQGSAQESKLVVIKYQGDQKNIPPIALVGKGVTFDTGGISIKPANHMDKMKYDMAGSAAVVGAIKSLALRAAKINVVGVVGLVENMPGHNAQRPGDIVTAMSGKTIEVLNTDAEGRLVLADALWYVQSKFSPKVIVDLATLTGAIVVALGSSYAGCFSQDQDLVNELKTAGEETGDKIWHMPLHKDYDEAIKSDFADIANISKCAGEAGSSTAAQFLKHFIKDGTKWAHLDIAGVAYNKKPQPKCIQGGNGFGVALLDRWISKYYEPKSGSK